MSARRKIPAEIIPANIPAENIPAENIPAENIPADGIAALANDITACRLCDRLVDWREEVARTKRASYTTDTYWGRAVPGFGDPAAEVLILGLAPAAHGANRTGRVFTGDRSGDWLFRALHRAGFANQPTSEHVDDGLTLHNAYVNAAVRCAPPDNKPTREERDTCRPFLDRELRLLTNLKVVVVLGQFAYDVVSSFVSFDARPKFGHGVASSAMFKTDRAREVTVVCSFHPSQQNTFTGRLTEPMFDAIFERVNQLLIHSKP